jgi:hypothetical protein
MNSLASFYPRAAASIWTNARPQSFPFLWPEPVFLSDPDGLRCKLEFVVRREKGALIQPEASGAARAETGRSLEAWILMPR